MIEFPNDPAPDGVEPRLVDAGFVQRGVAGPVGRVDRPGNHFAMALSYPVMKPDKARKFVARWLKAKREGLRVEMPLMGVSQGIPGAPLVDGAGQSGTSLAVKGLTPSYAIKEGFWLHIEDAAGHRYLHNVQATAIASGAGLATIVIEPPLRAPFADGDTIELAKPTVEGALTDDIGWSLSVDRLVRIGGGIVIEETA